MLHEYYAQKELDFRKVWGSIGGKHAKGWKGHRAWRVLRRKNAVQRVTKRHNAQWDRWAKRNPL